MLNECNIDDWPDKDFLDNNFLDNDNKWFNLAILYNKKSSSTASSIKTIERFIEIAIYHNVYCVLIEKEDIDLLKEFDGLFIRDTTHPDNYTCEFSRRAESLEIPVLDSTKAIKLGCNKIWQIQKFRQFFIPHPHSFFINKESYIEMTPENFPCVIKTHDGCFSKEVYRAITANNYKNICDKLFEESLTPKILIVQEFIKTDFDWRIGILNKKPLFACKYYIVEGDWKIIKYDRNGKHIEGAHETISINNIPKNVMEVISSCTRFLDDGLYGIDLKENDGIVYAIEINDNPTIDHGVEDSEEGEKLYNQIIKYFLDRKFLR